MLEKSMFVRNYQINCIIFTLLKYLNIHSVYYQQMKQNTTNEAN